MVGSSQTIGLSRTEVVGDQRAHTRLRGDAAEFAHIGVSGQVVVDQSLRKTEDRQAVRYWLTAPRPQSITYVLPLTTSAEEVP